VNSYERYLLTLAGQPVDHLPRLPILMQWAAEYIGSNYGAFASDYRVLVEANLRCAEDFDFDQVSAISDPYRETHGFGAQIEFVRDGVPRCLKPPLEDAPDLSLLADPDPHVSERMLDRVKAVELFRKEAGGTNSILGWVEGPAAEAADLRGVTNFLMDIMLDESFACALMDRCTEVGIAFARAQLEAGADTIGIGDAICSQMSPDVYERLVLPRQRQMVDAVHAGGGFVRLHICGNTTHLLPYVRDLGVDIYDCDWQVDMCEARNAVGTEVALCGNLDPVSGVKDASPESIRRRVMEIYDTVGDPFFVGAGCEIPPGTDPAKLRALCEPVF